MATLMQEIVGLFVKRTADPLFLLSWRDGGDPVFLTSTSGPKNLTAIVAAEDPLMMSRYVRDTGGPVGTYVPSMPIGCEAAVRMLRTARDQDHADYVYYVYEDERGKPGMQPYRIDIIIDHYRDLISRGYR